MMVGEGSTIGGRTYHGRAQAIQSANLAFDVSGSLIERPVKVGDSVEYLALLAYICCLKSY
jgi:multidrug efflux pump subunit AcrA (membrane-fusion protein)